MSLKEGEFYLYRHTIYLFREKNISLSEDGLQMLKVVNPRAELGGLLYAVSVWTRNVMNVNR